MLPSIGPYKIGLDIGEGQHRLPPSLSHNAQLTDVLSLGPGQGLLRAAKHAGQWIIIGFIPVGFLKFTSEHRTSEHS